MKPKMLADPLVRCRHSRFTQGVRKKNDIAA